MPAARHDSRSSNPAQSSSRSIQMDRRSRALSAGGELRPGPGLTDLRIGRGFEPRLVSGLLSGIHARDSSHFELLSAFLPGALELLYTLHAAAGGYRGHEFGDSTLVLG